MPKFFSFLKNKKALAFFVLFLVVIFGFALPSIAHAWWPCETWTCGVADTASEVVDWGPNTFANGIIYVLMLLPLVMSAVLSDLAGILLKGVLAVTTGGGMSYIHSTAVNVGWPIVRNLANMIIVLGFIVIGVATALRIKDYEAKKLLKNLIIVALLINFSLFICGVVIDASNILVNTFVKGFSLSDLWETSAIKTFVELTKTGAGGDNPIGFLAKAFATIFFNIMSMVVFFLYFFIFLFRFYAIWILVILSPLAFVFSVFPVTRKFYDMWLNNFIGWCFVAVPAGFFIWLSQNMSAEMAKIKSSINVGALFTGDFPDFSKSLTDMASFMIPGFFLIVGFIFTMQFSSSIAGGGLVKWAGGAAKKGGLAMGRAIGVNTQKAYSGALGWAGGKMAGSSSGAIDKIGRGMQWASKQSTVATLQKTRSAFGRLAGAAGMQAPEAQDVADTKRVNDEAAALAFSYKRAKATGDLGTIEQIRGYARDEKGIKGAAAVKVVSDAKDLSDAFKGRTDMTSRIDFAENTGAFGIREQEEKRDPRLRSSNRFLVDKKMHEAGFTGSQSDAEIAVAKEGFENASVADIREYNHDTLKSEEFAKHTSAKKMEKALQLMSTAKVNSAKTHILPTGSLRVGEAALNAKVKPLSPGDRDKLAEIKEKIATLNKA